ncbi:MAG: hypothetical protein KGJ28_13255 [Alphaproteobacteria bacterium]|nr:hypothetical protein [Alphaproteobacteria bacterium]
MTVEAPPGEGCISFTQRRESEAMVYPPKPHMKFRPWRELWALYKITEDVPAKPITRKPKD